MSLSEELKNLVNAVSSCEMARNKKAQAVAKRLLYLANQLPKGDRGLK